ncbi:hypothetical protein V1294_005368 [Bradyrhizobium sp. AZCC 1678]
MEPTERSNRGELAQITVVAGAHVWRRADDPAES